MNEGFGKQIVPGVVEHCLVRVAIDARLERRRTAAHRDKSAVLVVNAIDPFLAPLRHQHLAPGIEDVLYELARPHLIQLLREHGRGELCGGVVAEVALSLYDGQAGDEVQRVQGDIVQQVELVVLSEGQVQVLHPGALVLNMHEDGVNGNRPQLELEDCVIHLISAHHDLVVVGVLNVDHQQEVRNKRLDPACLLQQRNIAVLQGNERLATGLGERVNGSSDDPVRGRWRRVELPLLHPLNELDATLQQPLQLGLEVRPAIRVLQALAAHLQLQVLLFTQVDREGVHDLGERVVIDLTGGVLDDEVDLMRRTPDALDLVDGLLGHQHDEPAEPSCHCVLAVRVDRH